MRTLIILGLLLTAACSAQGNSNSPTPVTQKTSAEWMPVLDIFGLISRLPDARERSWASLEAGWHTAYTPMLLELTRLAQEPEFTARAFTLLEAKTGQRFDKTLDKAYRWLWQQSYTPHPEYAQFKAMLYRLVDPRFEAYFANERANTIRLDEVRWGGVAQNGIPPLNNPAMQRASEADWLADDHIVFGLEINGDARAYPKRILAWHELFTDSVGGLPVAGVYCTLCGALVLYETQVGDTRYQLGTSGFLYRSNKLMFDEKTQSLWNTLWGKPVIGPLVGSGAQLKYRSVVTTTWGEWRRRHPSTTVLSLQTGHERDYGEGIAYQNYFNNDDIMFAVPTTADSGKLLNKAEVLAIRHANEPVAISAAALKRQPLFTVNIEGEPLLVVTDTSGANRVYQTGGLQFTGYDGDRQLRDANGVRWQLSESALTAGRKTLVRVPAHRAFWFGWQAAYPETRLIQ